MENEEQENVPQSEASPPIEDTGKESEVVQEPNEDSADNSNEGEDESVDEDEVESEDASKDEDSKPE